MPPKQKYSREQIVEAAFEIACTDGVSGLTIRKIAGRLGSSVAPVYVNFADAEQLHRAVIARIAELSDEMLSAVDTGEPLKDIGAASLRMATEYPVLVRDLMFSPDGYLRLYSERADPAIMARMADDPALEGLEESDLRTLLLKLRIVQTGMSVSVANDLLPRDFAESDCRQLQDELNATIIQAATPGIETLDRTKGEKK